MFLTAMPNKPNSVNYNGTLGTVSSLICPPGVTAGLKSKIWQLHINATLRLERSSGGPSSEMPSLNKFALCHNEQFY